MKFDAIVIGAGFAGAVAARRLAEDGGMRIMVLEQRDHIGGNAYDCKDGVGIRVHVYGPHIFHTDDGRVFRYLSRFTKWRPYAHSVIADVPGPDGRREQFPVPFNLDSLSAAFGRTEGTRLVQVLTDAYPGQVQMAVLDLLQNKDPDIAHVASYVYEHVFLGYTMKQWGLAPDQVDPSVTARVPVRLSHDGRYFLDRYQCMPVDGYEAMFQAMLDHSGITVRLGEDGLDRISVDNGRVYLDGGVFDGPVIYTGQADRLFGFCYGMLPYRTLRFEHETLHTDRFQPCGTVNYTMDHDFTRITEWKYITGQVMLGVTSIMREYPAAYTGGNGQIPYYAVLGDGSRALYQKYAALARQTQGLYLLGRLAEYRYYNMDAVAARALELSDQILLAQA